MLLLLLAFSESVVVANDVHECVVVIVSNKVTVNFMVFMVCVCTRVRTHLPVALSLLQFGNWVKVYISAITYIDGTYILTCKIYMYI